MVYNETSKKLHAFVDYDNLYINKTGFIILSPDIEYILGILHSTLFDYFYRHEFPSWGDPWAGGRVQFRGDRMAKVPIAKTDNKTRKAITDLVSQIQDAKKKAPDANVYALERRIDRIIYDLYSLTPEEIAIIEEAVSCKIKPH